ncbi:type II toxin-antitoxin system VapC family toxin [Acidisoma cladoniae]|uniref:type II toxin-antitoxin system VapC family toxin n=1 Tax=Acidisoma cladoniae TaxID=3040935 RepID=UPI00254B836A|nr:type II toxin-antitoxin system VapC family toxin [Acidisoma sp. PAMC 29798]
MIYLLDSNAVIALFAGHLGFITRLKHHRPTDVGLSSIVAHELYFGAYKSRKQAENLARVEAHLFEVLPFDQQDARQAGELRAALSVSGTPIGPYDVLIAGQALAKGLTLITRNLREFERVPSLLVENWEV